MNKIKQIWKKNVTIFCTRVYFPYLIDIFQQNKKKTNKYIHKQIQFNNITMQRKYILHFIFDNFKFYQGIFFC